MLRGGDYMQTKKLIVLGVVAFGFLIVSTPAYAHGYQLLDKNIDNGKTTWTFEGDPIVLPRDLNGSVDLSTLSQEQRTELVSSWQGSTSHHHNRGFHWNKDWSNDEDTSDDNSSDEFDVTLSPDNEVPAVDSDGEGTANVRLLKDEGLVCVDLEVSGIDLPATAAHIHKAPKGEDGDVVLTLSAPNEDGDSYGCVKADDSVITDMMDHPEGYYVNVHNAEFPDGVMRGQLSDSEEE